MGSPEHELNKLLRAELEQGYFTSAYAEAGYLDESEPRLRFFQSASGAVFDLASLTKALVTGPLVHQILKAKKLDFSAPLEAWAPDGVRLPAPLLQLRTDEVLGHVSGLPAWWNFWIHHLPDGIRSRKEALARIEEVMARIPLGLEKKDIYSDVGYILLGYLLEKSGPIAPLIPLQEPFDYAPRLGLKTSDYVPTAVCKIRERLIRGEVHDENCAALGGIAGHAGLFGTGEALSQYLRHLARTPQGIAYLEANEKIRQETSRDGLLGLRRGNGLSSAPFAGGQGMGHLGFTGTAFWLEWSSKKYGIFLSNRVISGRVSSRITDIRRTVFQLLDASLG